MDIKCTGLRVRSCVLFFVVAVISRGVETSGANGKILVCYYVPTNRIPISIIPADLCTHIIFAFGEVTKDGITPVRSSDVTRYNDLVALKKKESALKVLLSLQNGFPSVVDEGLSVMKTFTQNAIVFLRKYGFDGIDFDWEFPSATQRDNYMKLLTIFRDAVDAESAQNGLSPLQISMALSNNRVIAARAYNIPTVNKCIDFATVMTYDFHVFNAKTDNLTGYNSPLYSPKGESKYSSVSGMIGYYIDGGLDQSKTLMGVPTYGRTYTLTNPSQHGLHAPASDKGPGGPVIHSKGVYINEEVCMILSSGATSVTDKDAGVPYLYKDDIWITYDDIESLQIKCNWALASKLAGFGVWALTLDDVSGACAGGNFPMIAALKSCSTWKLSNTKPEILGKSFRLL